jgi:hypothetical protein
VLVCLGVLAMVPPVESQAAPQGFSHGGDCPRLSMTRAKGSAFLIHGRSVVTLTPTFSAAQPAHNKQLNMIKSEGEIVISYEGEPLHTIDQDGNVSSDD